MASSLKASYLYMRADEVQQRDESETTQIFCHGEMNTITILPCIPWKLGIKYNYYLNINML